MLAFYILAASTVIAVIIIVPAYLRRSRFALHRIILWLAPLALVVGVVLVLLQTARLEKTEAMKKWPGTNGVIVNSWLEGERAMHPVVKYAYSVDSTGYIKEDTIYTPSFGGKRRKYEVSIKTLALYPPGDSINVHYDPADPSRAHIAIHENWDLFGKLAFGFTLYILGLLVIIAPKRKGESPQ